MKKLFFVLFLLYSANGMTQNYPMPDSGGVWINQWANYYVGTWNFPVWTFDHFVNYCTPGEDTIINSNTYFKIDTCGGNYKGAMRDSAGVVYFVPGGESNENLLYNFSDSP